MRRFARREAAFTRLELVAVLAALVLLATVALPLLANSRVQSDPDRVTCLNNLRRIGQAYQLWGNDHGEGLPARIPACSGGLQGGSALCLGSSAGFINNAWFHFAWISNELATPSILACPSDRPTKVARDFSGSPDGGFMNAAYRANALSYLVTLDVFPGMALTFISGDRNLQVQGYGYGCSSGVTVAQNLRTNPTESYWTPDLHDGTGNLLLYDGRVLQTSSESMRRYMDSTLIGQGDNGSTHILLPRW